MAQTANIEQLNVKITTISAQRRELKAQMRELVKVRDALAAAQAVTGKVAAMSPAEREAMAAALAGEPAKA